jgi:inner membrane transporter RhtA
VSKAALSPAKVPPWALAVASMTSVQLGSALSVHLISSIGPAGTAWLRLTMGAVIFLALARPPLRTLRRPDVATLTVLGVTTGLQTIAFLAAIERIPLGTVVAIEFLGPLTVAAVRSHSVRALIWPGLALAGVAVLTQPWHGHVSPAGLGFAGLAAAGWAVYIVLTQRVGDRFAGIQGLSLTVPIAAGTAAILGIPEAAGHLTLGVLPEAAGLALLLPALPYALEMLALRRMTSHAFGTLMALEPAIGVLLGLLVLHQTLSPVQVVGILLVVLAGTAAQRTGRRPARARAPIPAASARAASARAAPVPAAPAPEVPLPAALLQPGLVPEQRPQLIRRRRDTPHPPGGEPARDISRVPLQEPGALRIGDHVDDLGEVDHDQPVLIDQQVVGRQVAVGQPVPGQRDDGLDQLVPERDQEGPGRAQLGQPGGGRPVRVADELQ